MTGAASPPALRLLYVDDDADIRHIVALSLRLDGAIDARFAGSGEEALELLRAEPQFDAALVDVMMAGMGGMALAEEMRERGETRDVPVIFVTARGREADLDAYRARGAAGVIVKPFDPLTLPAEIRRQLGQAKVAQA